MYIENIKENECKRKVKQNATKQNSQTRSNNGNQTHTKIKEIGRQIGEQMM